MLDTIWKASEQPNQNNGLKISNQVLALSGMTWNVGLVFCFTK